MKLWWNYIFREHFFTVSKTWVMFFLYVYWVVEILQDILPKFHHCFKYLSVHIDFLFLQVFCDKIARNIAKKNEKKTSFNRKIEPGKQLSRRTRCKQDPKFNRQQSHKSQVPHEPKPNATRFITELNDQSIHPVVQISVAIEWLVIPAP